jgi:hypothetical protein
MDMTVTYEWNPGALPPPSYYELRVSISSRGDASVEVRPDYGFNNPPVWSWNFTLEQTQAVSLLRNIAATRDAGGSASIPVVGGSQETITLEEGGQSREVEAVPRLTEALRSMVPRNIWDEIEERRAAYAAKGAD